MIVFDDEGHGVVKLANQVTANSRILAFLQDHLLGAGELDTEAQSRR